VKEEWVAWDQSALLRALGISELQTQAALPETEAVSGELVRAAHRKFVTGITIVGGMDRDGAPFGLAVNAFMSVSLSPPTIMVCIGRSSRSHDRFLIAEAFSVNILAADQTKVAARFASSEPDKFAQASWRRGLLATPLIDGCCASFEARIIECVRASTHTIFVGRVMSVDSCERAPLVYLAGGMYDPSAFLPVA
jgi:flavin reductase (DIM6/NTAB) family NADH-FMN oxidoreductase RutF